jgi:hypothetical protein
MRECSEIGELELSSLTIPSTTSLTCIICPELHTFYSTTSALTRLLFFTEMFLPCSESLIFSYNLNFPPSQSSSSSGISKVSVDQRRLHDEANERKDFEEERFVRLVSADSNSMWHFFRPVALTMISILSNACDCVSPSFV